MNLLRRVQRLNNVLQSTTIRDQSPWRISLLACRSAPRHFSTEGADGVGESVVEPPTPAQDTFDSSSYSATPVDAFPRPPAAAFCYAKMAGIHRNTLKTDVITILEGSKLTPDDVKFIYNRNFFPVAALVQFPSRTAYNASVRAVMRHGRMYKLEVTNESEWNFTKPYNGKYVLLQGIPVNSTIDDIDRFLTGFDYDASSIELMTRQNLAGRLAIIRFPSQIEAMSAAIRKNRAFLQSFQVTVRVLQ